MKLKCPCGVTTNLKPDEFPFFCSCKRRYEAASLKANGPSAVRRLGNFAMAAASHLASGSAIVDDATREWRRSQCLSCTEYFDPEKETCLHVKCGCGIKKHRGIIDALGWASKQCPIGRWQYEPITTRNLIYHVYPSPANDRWRKNVRQLLKRWHVFNGRRIIAIARGGDLQWDKVHSEFRGEDYEFFYLENDPELREVATFSPLLEQVASPSHNEATFYAHTKGNATAWQGDPRGPIWWRNEMYHKLLDFSSDCMTHLRSHPCVGTHKLCWNGRRASPFPTGLENKHQWMFCGTFFWFRNDMVFTHPRWREVPRDRYGAEAWLGGMFDKWQGKTMFQPWPEYEFPSASPYHHTLYTNPIDDEPI